MLRNICMSKGMYLQNRQDVAIHHVPEEVISALYAGDGEHFMVESVDMADIESTYFYDTPVIPELNAVMFEAVTSTRARLSGTMRAFIRALNQSLNGTGIIAGNDTSGAADDGSQAMGGANIGRVRKVQGIAVMPAIIPLSDGQTITLVFHSPTGDASTITAADTLVAFQFLLNKKDVTHVVSPSNGRDISLKVVTTALSNLIERNTAKYQHAQAKQKAIKADIANMQAEGDKLEEQQAGLAEQGDTLKTAIQNDSQTLSDLTNKADKQEELNAELQSELAAAQKKKDDTANSEAADRKARADALTAIRAKSGYKDTYVANWAYNEKIPTADLVDLAGRLSTVDVSDLKDLIMYKGQVSDLSDIPALKARNSVPPANNDPGPRTLYWYGLRARPAGLGALPQNPKTAVTATEEEAADIPIVKAKAFDPSTYRYGAVAYAAPLDAADVTQYELVDFQTAQTSASYDALLNDLIPLIQAYPGNENQFYLDYLNKDAPKADDLPQSMKDAGGFETIRQTMGSQATLNFIAFFKQVRKDSPAPPPAPVDKPKDTSGVQLSDGDTVPLDSIQTGAMMPTIAKGATNGDNPIWYTQSTLNDIVASAKVKINGQPATSNPEFAESRYQMVKAAMAAGFGMQRFKISGLQYIYVLRKDDDILTAQGAAKFMPTAEAPTVDPAPTPPPTPTPDTAVNNGYVSVKPTPSEAGSIAEQVRALGIDGGILAEKLHVTVMYSKDHAISIQPEPGRTYLARLTGEYKIIGDAPYEALVAVLDSADLNKRFDELTVAGAVHSYPEYLPHLSLKYNPAPADLELIKAKGLDITTIHLSGETFKPIDGTPAKPAPTPDPAPPVTPGKEPDPVEPEKPEADTDAQKAIDYLKQVAQMDSGDMIEIRTARNNVRAAIAALTDAGVYDENEDLVNAAAQRLSDLLAAVAQKGAA